MAILTTWEAEKDGYFQGTPTPGQALDWVLSKIPKLPKVPKPEAFKGHWKTWPEGKPIAVNEAWLSDMISKGQLPTREQVTYSGSREDRAEMRAMAGSHVIVEILDTDRKTRHRCILLGNILFATAEGWREAQKAA
jgi:hypothetical protein